MIWGLTKKGTALGVLICIAVCLIPAEELKDKHDFRAPDASESTVTAQISDDFDPKKGLWVSAAGAAAGMTLTLLSTQNLIENSLNDPYGPEIQRSLVFTGGSLIGTAVFTVFADYFIQRIKEDQNSTSRE